MHNQNEAYIKQAITKEYIRKVLKQGELRAQPLEIASRAITYIIYINKGKTSNVRLYLGWD